MPAVGRDTQCKSCGKIISWKESVNNSWYCKQCNGK